ncbi:MAG: preprotein translocase subunit SecG [Oligoflexia bacterium]|nr:preprotein translocase subunit SecG [Oligoflexia bacterium]
MFYFLLILQAVLCVMLIGIVLLQQGKGADMGAAFGGGSNTLFGAAGAGNMISKITTGICVAFMITSVLLVRAYQERGFVRADGQSDPLAGSVMQNVAAKMAEDEKPQAAAQASSVAAAASSISAAAPAEAASQPAK